MSRTYATLEEMIVETAESIRPSERLTVSQAASKYRMLKNPGSYEGPWLNEKTPYLVEPMDVLNSRDFTGMVFVGPAQCGKTDMLLNWITYSAVCDPADMMVVQMSQTTARDFSKRRVDKLFRQSPEVGRRRAPGRQNQNVYDTMFKSGMYLTTSWPTINELSGKPIPRLWLTDYDRMPDDIDTNGSPYDLAKTRSRTFKRFGMTVAESSPGRIVEDGRWTPKTPHEAPPTTGILALYNRGDRRRQYWDCPQCRAKFEPDFKHFAIPDPDFGSILDRAEATVMGCPVCGLPIAEDKRSEMNLKARWIKEGEVWMPDGSITGTPRRSDIASFWMMGPAAGLGEWRTIVGNYLKAQEEFELTGSQEALKTTINTDQGKPYVLRGSTEARLPENLKEKQNDVPLGVVPYWVRFLIATIDVQKHSFQIQIHGIGPGGDCVVVDRFAIKTSKRVDDTAGATGQFYWISPHSYLEDWDLLIEGVLEKTYPIDGDDRRMAVKITGCDSGGREGVTKNAYDFWRRLRKDRDISDHWQRFQLLKGDPSKTAPRVAMRFPDSERKDRKAGARGEVPILMLNPNMLKDQVDGMMGRDDEKGYRLSFNAGLPASFYNELTAETRGPKGWENPKDKRNEAWDLLVYAMALALSRHIQIEHINWEKPPGWAKPLDDNDLVFMPSNKPEEMKFVPKPKAKYDLAALSDSLG